jgi:hypothetical protein
MVHAMVIQLTKREPSNFHFVLYRDESWFVDAFHYSTIWAQREMCIRLYGYHAEQEGHLWTIGAEQEELFKEGRAEQEDYSRTFRKQSSHFRIDGAR